MKIGENVKDKEKFTCRKSNAKQNISEIIKFQKEIFHRSNIEI